MLAHVHHQKEATKRENSLLNYSKNKIRILSSLNFHPSMEYNITIVIPPYWLMTYRSTKQGVQDDPTAPDVDLWSGIQPESHKASLIICTRLHVSIVRQSCFTLTTFVISDTCKRGMTHIIKVLTELHTILWLPQTDFINHTVFCVCM